MRNCPEFPNPHRLKARQATRCFTACALICWSASLAWGQSITGSTPDFRSSPPALPSSEPYPSLPSDAYVSNPDFGVPTHTLFRNTRAFPLPQPNAVTPRPTVQSDSLTGNLHIDAPTLSGNFPLLQKGFAPQNADFKFGPAYFKLDALSAGVIFSDNINLDRDRESGVISIMRLTGTFIVQLSEDLHLEAAGSLIFLPQEGRFGVGGSASHIPYSLGLAVVPAVRSQIAWDTMIFGLPIVLADNFDTRIGTYDSSSRDDFYNFQSDNPDAEDRAGRYVFRVPSHTTNDDHNRTFGSDEEFLVFQNEVSATMDRLLPDDLRLHVKLYHDNLWYAQGEDGLPKERDGADVLLQDENPNLRFKPFVSYEMLYTDSSDSFSHAFRLGITGPITDQLQMLLDGGVFYYTRDSSLHALYDLHLVHIAGPYTRESLYIGRTQNEFNDEILTGARYDIHQILGPRMSATAFISVGEVQDLLGEYREQDQLRTGLLLQWRLGPRTNLELGGIYAREIHDPVSESNEDTITGRADLLYRFTDTLYGRLLYQYQQRQSNEVDRNYYENLVFISLTKYFH